MKPFLIFIIFLSSFVSCMAQKAKPSVEAESVELSDTWTEDHMEDLLFVTKGLKDFKGYMALTISKAGDLDVLSIEDGTPGNPGPSAKEVCNQRGDVAFAKCVGKWLQEHPGQCLRVWIDSRGNHADDDCTR